MEGSFEYGRDIALLYGSLRSAERLLSKQVCGPATELDECATYSETVSRGVQNAYKGAVTKDNVDKRMHCALLCNVLVTSGILKKEELSYFESILDNIPRFSIRIYFAVIERCGWTDHFIQALKALPKSIRLAFLRKAHSYTEDSYHTWLCLVSVLAWSVYIEPIQGT
ncbi:uncharacterized protein LOC135369506 [Ornithodoros turicata]|uniref:uncharacterized protein LOC135369506 n=1 Tax=Ornithodoros turicata TaxID=34597 RepID=UPI003138ACDC